MTRDRGMFFEAHLDDFGVWSKQRLLLSCLFLVLFSFLFD